MKKVFLFFILTSISLSGNSQEEQKDFSKENYLQKSKNQRTVGWVLLGAGAAVGTVGIIVTNEADSFFEDSGKIDTGLTLFAVGAASTLASIPFFIIAGSNSRKAASLSLESQRFIIPGQGLSGIQPALSLKIEL